MMMSTLKRSRYRKRLAARNQWIDNFDLDQSRPSFSERASLVDDDAIDAVGASECIRAGDDDAVFRGSASANAQGQAAASTASTAGSARVMSTCDQYRPVPIATASITTVKRAAMR